MQPYYLVKVEFSSIIDYIEFSEIVIAELADIGFESFVENGNGSKNTLEAFIPEDLYNSTKDKEVLEVLSFIDKSKISVSPTVKKEVENFNKKWEDSFEPVIVSDDCVIYAEFHKEEFFGFSKYRYGIKIAPKMSFGTGHHPTTFLMLRGLLDKKSLDNQKVLDVGTGSGILSILACKLNAVSVLAFDIEEWAVENAKENYAFNLTDFSKCQFLHSNSTLFSTLVSKGEKYDLILANINKNIILQDLEKYSNVLGDKGVIFLSGFLEDDIKKLTLLVVQLGLQIAQVQVLDGWGLLKVVWGVPLST